MAAPALDSRGQDGLGYPLVNISFFFLIPRINANPKPLLSHSLIKSLVVVCFLGRLSTVPPELGCRKSEVPGMCLSSPLSPQWLLKSSPAEAENNQGNQVVQSGPFSSASATHFEHPAFQPAPGFLGPPIWNKEVTALALHHGTHILQQVAPSSGVAQTLEDSWAISLFPFALQATCQVLVALPPIRIPNHPFCTQASNISQQETPKASSLLSTEQPGWSHENRIITLLSSTHTLSFPLHLE